MITVQDVIHFALPQGTQVVAGETGLDREVTWVTFVCGQARPPLAI